jgi:hypothetical protein
MAATRRGWVIPIIPGLSAYQDDAGSSQEVSFSNQTELANRRANTERDAPLPGVPKPASNKN